MKKILFILFLLIAVPLSVGYYFLKDSISEGFFEKTAPKILQTGSIKAIGATTRQLAFEVNDEGSGVDEVVVRLTQNGKTQTLFQQKFQSPENKSVPISIDLDGKKLGIREGSAEIDIKAFDKSFWSNEAEEKLTLAVDFIKPRPETLTVFQYGTVGGSLLSAYRVLSDDVVESGAKIGTSFYPGVLASNIDPAFENEKNLYFVLFPLGIGFNPQTDRVEIYVKDAADNYGISSLPQKIAPKKFSEVDMKMPRQFFIDKTDLLLSKYREESGLDNLMLDATTANDLDLSVGFTKVNKDYRNFLEKKLLEITTSVTPKKYWSGPFIRPLPAKPTATFAEKRNYFINETPASTSVHMGVDLADSSNSVVRAASGGKVVFADDFGIYGNSIVIDHGIGLMSLYGHLSSIKVNVGDEVSQSDEIGRTGSTGLAGGDHLHFEIRLHGVPVTPIEWFDNQWFQYKIFDQIKFVKDILLTEQKERT